MKLSLKVAAIVAMSVALVVAAAPSSKRIVLSESNSVTLSDVNVFSIDTVISALSNRDKEKPFYLYIDSPGGEVFAGKRLIDYLDGDSKNVVCVASNAMSMAFVTLQACPTRLVTRNVALMSHGIQMGVQGDLRAIDKQVELGRALELMLSKISAARLGITVEELNKLHNPEYWLVGGDVAVAAKAADEVVTVSCDSTLKGKTKKKVQTMFGQIEVEVNKCPI
jgi:ATP-dependent Clp protease protease subunit